MLSVDLPNVKDGFIVLELLRYIVKLWLTIRGFGCLRRGWRPEYKSTSYTITKGKKSLRKNLRIAGEPPE